MNDTHAKQASIALMCAEHLAHTRSLTRPLSPLETVADNQATQYLTAYAAAPLTTVDEDGFAQIFAAAKPPEAQPHPA